MELESIAWKQLKSKQYDQAIASFTSLLALDLSSSLFVGRSQAYAKLGFYTHAAVDAKVGLTLDPVNINAHFALANALYLTNSFELALHACDKALLISPSDQRLLQLSESCSNRMQGLDDPDPLRLFDLSAHGHSHGHGHDHNHDHGHEHGHDHDHGHGHHAHHHEHDEHQHTHIEAEEHNIIHGEEQHKHECEHEKEHGHSHDQHHDNHSIAMGKDTCCSQHASCNDHAGDSSEEGEHHHHNHHHNTDSHDH